MFKHYLRILGFPVIVGLSACAGIEQPQLQDITDSMTKEDEVDRLRYFYEVNAGQALKHHGLSGKGTLVTIMGEMVDATHPDLTQNVRKQYNTFSQKGVVLAGTGNQPYGAEHLGPNDGHGTHIAGTIAAACDGVGIQGLACNAQLDVYGLGAYDDVEGRFPIKGWGDANEYERLLGAFKVAMEDVVDRNSSRIVTGSFNIEAPAIQYQPGGSFQGRTMTDIMQVFDDDIESVDDLYNGKHVLLTDQADRDYLRKTIEKNEGDKFIGIGSIINQSAEWAELEQVIAEYQAGDGVYLVTESNYDFDNRTSVLNAMPSLSDKVDEDLWLSVVMVQPQNLEQLLSNENATAESYRHIDDYITPINSCGELAADYCILTPSWIVLSTMTERVAQGGNSPLFEIEGRLHQLFEGHSMGAPMVAAALALMEEYNQRENFGYSMKNLVQILKQNANRSFDSYDPVKHGQGVLDISAAITAMVK